jgi:hypothetical protein
MATSSYPTISAGVGKTQADKFIPELWSDEILATFQQNLVIANHVSRMTHNGKKGDLIHIPSPTRGSASDKAALTGVTLQNATEGEVQVAIYKHKEYSRLIEDIVGVQALSSLRSFYVQDAGYATATRIDRDLALLWHYLNGGAAPTNANLFETAVSGADGSTTFDSANDTTTSGVLTDAAIRRMMQTLDDNDVPMSERVIILPPVEKKNLLGIARFTEQAFVGESGGGNSIRNGLIGNVYGMPIYVTTNCPVLHVQQTANTQVVNFSTTQLSAAGQTGEAIPGPTSDVTLTAVDFSSVNSTRYRIGAMLHKSALVFIEQMSPRVQTQYKQEYLADLLTTDTIYGVGRLRDGSSVTNSLATAGLAFVVPA